MPLPQHPLRDTHWVLAPGGGAGGLGLVGAAAPEAEYGDYEGAPLERPHLAGPSSAGKVGGEI